MGNSLLQSILTMITQLVSGIEGEGGVIRWAVSFLGVIADNTVLLLICIVVPLVGLGIGVIRRLTRIRA